MSHKYPLSKQARVAIIGGGVAGSTIALRLAELGIDTTIFEKGKELVNGPPICHLHAGGNLYRDISDDQCMTLLRQSIDTLRVFHQSINWRPTVIALPVSDAGKPEHLLPRLQILQKYYADLVDADLANKVLGEPHQYFSAYQRSDLDALANRPLPAVPLSLDDWMIPVAKNLALDTLQYPVYLVQEYGISLFRFASTVSLAMSRLSNLKAELGQRVSNLSQAQSDGPFIDDGCWQLEVTDEQGARKVHQFDFVVNACGFRTGEIDDMLSLPRQRMVEFKAAYLAKSKELLGCWPELVIHGPRGTPDGMAQLTPYHDGLFQLHGMTKGITLFDDGLVSSSLSSAQPRLADHFIEKIEDSWPQKEVQQRTRAAIDHVARFVPVFASSFVAGKPMFGAQQIPGDDASLRAASVSFVGTYYARAEIVKASSALSAADAILQHLLEKRMVHSLLAQRYAKKHYFPVTNSCDMAEVVARGEALAESRRYSAGLATQSYFSDKNRLNALPDSFSVRSCV